MKALLAAGLLSAALAAFAPSHALAQSGVTVLGDIRVDDRKAPGTAPMNYDVILYRLGGTILARDRVPNNGRYRFMGVRSGEYQIAIEVDAQEIARVNISVGASSGSSSELQQNFEFEWTPGTTATAKKATVSAFDFYKREGANQSNFDKAQAEMDKKRYEQAAALLSQVTAADPQDFQAWTELGTARLLQGKKGDAEKAYQRAAEARPGFALALLNLGRMRSADKRYEEAVEPLTRAVEAQPDNAEARLLLGDAYLQLKKGSKGVPHLNEAARLGRHEAHQMLAALYNAVGRKDLAAAEYEQLLAKQPDHPDRKKLEQYVKENKKQ
jgi:tetratricopeptide (TPR) repeat protein